MLLNGDFVKPDGTTWTYEPGRFETARHLEFLRQAGFANPMVLASYEPNTEAPTSAQNYACMMDRGDQQKVFATLWPVLCQPRQ